jgi:hypothetical protein
MLPFFAGPFLSGIDGRAGRLAPLSDTPSRPAQLRTDPGTTAATFVQTRSGMQEQNLVRGNNGADVAVFALLGPVAGIAAALGRFRRLTRLFGVRKPCFPQCALARVGRGPSQSPRRQRGAPGGRNGGKSNLGRAGRQHGCLTEGASKRRGRRPLWACALQRKNNWACALQRKDY